MGEREGAIPARQIDSAPRVEETAPSSAGASPLARRILELQRSIGNRAVGAFLSGAQPKLTVGAAVDPCEQEADAIAEQVVARLRSDDPSAEPANAAAHDEHEEGEDHAHRGLLRRLRRTVSPAESAEIGLGGGDLDAGAEAHVDALRAGGTPLPANVRRSMEGAFGADFSGVRVHHGAESETLNRKLGAAAFTVGGDIFLGAATQSLEQPAGQRLLAHELVHTVQQGAARLVETTDSTPLSPSRVQRQPAAGVGVSFAIGSAHVAGKSPSSQFRPIRHDRGANVGPSVQRRIGVEMEVPWKQEQKDPPEHAGKASWAKRDIVYKADTWDLTLDDTPGWPRFNLEFILGGANRQGFEDEDVQGLLAAVTSIKTFVSKTAKAVFAKPLTQTADGNARDRELTISMPEKLPTTANVQLTAGASLAGLQAVFAQHAKNMEDEMMPGKEMQKLVFWSTPQTSLAKSYVSPAQLLESIPSLPEDVSKNGGLMDALSSMVSLIRTFLDNYSPSLSNVKEATPILWKTPLNLFFDSNDLKELKARKDFVQLWEAVVAGIFKDKLATEISYPPAGAKDDDGKPVPQDKFTAGEWLKDLPSRDRLSDADKKYDKSIGGIGKLEGGKGSSKGQPLFEFRAFPNSVALLERYLRDAALLLEKVNKPSNSAIASGQKKEEDK